MKKFLLIVIVCLINSITLNAQSCEKYYMYGVDFTHTNVYGAEESVEQFKNAFEGINMLFLTEPQKYDFSKIIDKRVELMIEPISKLNASNDFNGLKTFSSTYDAPEYSKVIKEYELKETEGVGIVLIAKLLNKTENKGIYELITFDISTREILSTREVSGKARGFGLRNYWAGSIYSIIKSVKL